MGSIINGPVEVVRISELGVATDELNSDMIFDKATDAVSKKSSGATFAGKIPHNDLFGKQGGVTDEYYHLTAAEYAALGSASRIESIDTLNSLDFELAGDEGNGIMQIGTGKIFSLINSVDTEKIRLTPDAEIFSYDTVATRFTKIQGNNITLTGGSAIGNYIISDNSSWLRFPVLNGTQYFEFQASSTTDVKKIIKVNGNISTVGHIQSSYLSELGITLKVAQVLDGYDIFQVPTNWRADPKITIGNAVNSGNSEQGTTLNLLGSDYVGNLNKIAGDINITAGDSSSTFATPTGRSGDINIESGNTTLGTGRDGVINISLSGRDVYISAIALYADALPVFATEIAAAALNTDQIYKTATGELRIKL